MNAYLYKNKLKITLLGVFSIITGTVLAYLKWGIEPEETIAGVFCGLGFGLTIIGLGLQKTKE